MSGRTNKKKQEPQAPKGDVKSAKLDSFHFEIDSLGDGSNLHPFRAWGSSGSLGMWFIGFLLRFNALKIRFLIKKTLFLLVKLSRRRPVNYELLIINS